MLAIRSVSDNVLKMTLETQEFPFRALKWSSKYAEGQHTKQGPTFSVVAHFIGVEGEFREVFGDYILLIALIHQA